ncbi:hypothetical protein ACNSOP_09210 [Aliarcobacter lanthieri]|uniref:phage baseplate plug family protein n=1 Tax=Aliarcobacter lanthieri TaxID=1355374 RepID=UPI003AAF9E32
MKIVKLNLFALPNQSLSFEDDNNFYTLRLFKGKENTTLCDISVNDESVIKGVAVQPNQPIIPYKYLCKDGNFFITTPTDNDEIDYNKFGINQFLYFGYFE